MNAEKAALAALKAILKCSTKKQWTYVQLADIAKTYGYNPMSFAWLELLKLAGGGEFVRRCVAPFA